MKKILNLKKVHHSKVVYDYIYPVFTKEFLFMNNYEQFAEMVKGHFILNPDQWEALLEAWELKEEILTED